MASLLVSRQRNVNRQAWYMLLVDPDDDHDDFQAWSLITSDGVGVLCVSIVWQFASHLTMTSSSLDGSMFCA